MDLTWSDGEEAFRAEARAWLEENLAAWHADHGGEDAIASGDTREGFAQHLDWERRLLRGPLGRGVVAERGRRARRLAVGVADLRGGVLPGRRAAPGHPERHLPAGPHRVRVRDARAAGARPAPHGGGRGPVVPGLVRARRRQRPGGHQGPGHPGRRRLAARRPEDVDHPGRVLHPPVRPVPHRPRVRAAPRPQLPAGPARHAGRHGPRVRAARRRRGVRRGVLRRRLPGRRRRPRRGAAGRRGRRLEGGDGDDRVRAGPDAALARAVPRHRGAADRPVPRAIRSPACASG